MRINGVVPFNAHPPSERGGSEQLSSTLPGTTSGWAEIEAAEKAKLAEAQARGEKLAGLTLQIVQKAGVDGKLFGSVTNADIVAALAAQGFEVEKSQVRMPEGHIKQIGDHPLNIALHTDVVVGITLSVLGEQ